MASIVSDSPNVIKVVMRVVGSVMTRTKPSLRFCSGELSRACARSAV